jgi:hypothetical protein
MQKPGSRAFTGVQALEHRIGNPNLSFLRVNMANRPGWSSSCLSVIHTCTLIKSDSSGTHDGNDRKRNDRPREGMTKMTEIRPAWMPAIRIPDLPKA